MLKGLRFPFVVLIQVLVLQACSLQTGFAQISWARTLDEAKTKAAGSKLIIADMYADWCGWCKKMDVETWANPQVIEQQSKYVFLKLNSEKEPDGIALRKKFSIDGFPTVMILNPDGSEFDRLEGYLPGPQFLAKLNEAVSNPESLGNLKAMEARGGQSLQLRFKLASRLTETGSYAEAQSHLEQIILADPGNNSGVTPNALFFLAVCQASRNQEVPALATIDRLRRQFPTTSRVPEACVLSGEILISLGRKAEAKARLEEFLKIYPNHRMVPQAKQLLATLSQS